MRRLALAVLAFCLAMVPAAKAEEWSKTFSLTGKPSLRVETSDANIHVSTWDQTTIQARVTTEGWKIGEGGIRIIDRQAGDAVELEVRFPHNVFNIGFSRKVDIDIVMPREGQVRLNTGDGRIVLRDLKGSMELQSGDGRLEVSSVEGTLRAHTGDGKVKVEGLFEGLAISTGDGAIEARALPGSSIGSGWTLQTGDGGVVLAIPQELAADVELDTGDGHISLDLPMTVEGRMRESHIQGKLNGGGSLLKIHTGDGSIRLEKATSL